ncbi:hypothetical protein ID866_8545 [Astraeus odoratus]|nr:hypothetical protein ID866_8545 [Astraeus odoratus]
MHDPHTDLFLMPAGIMQIGLSLTHLMHTDMLAQLLLAWASESAHCHFLASAAAAIVCQYSCQTSSSMYLHLVSSSWPSVSASPLLLPPSVTVPPLLSNIFLPLQPGTSILTPLPLNILSLPSIFLHHVLCIVTYAFLRSSCCPPNLCCQYQSPILHLAPSSNL